MPAKGNRVRGKDMETPKAPRDPEKKREGFYIVREKEIMGSIQPDGSGIQFLYLNDGRLVSSARITGGIADEEMLGLLRTAKGFRRLVHSMGIAVEIPDGGSQKTTVDFVFQMYGKKDSYGSGTVLHMPVPVDGMEHILKLEECVWSEDDEEPGQIRFAFGQPDILALVSVKLYLQEGFTAPEPEVVETVDFASPYYQQMLEKSVMQTGNSVRLKRALERARQGEDVTIAFIGGSITQGAGAVPIHTKCYAYRVFEGLCRLAGKGTEENIHYIKAGVGGTSSELGMLRYERDVRRDGRIWPDIVVVEFAVNDEGDETKGECYDSLVRKILSTENRPAVILLFSVFANDWNLQERLSPVGRAYGLPMVSVRDAVTEQFYQKPEEGRVISKYQFFYDSYHPTNAGHQIMADALLHLLEMVDRQPVEGDGDLLCLDEIEPPIGGEFQWVELLDRGKNWVDAKIQCGDFCGIDSDLQVVEMDRELIPVKEFQNNWFYQGTLRGNGEAGHLPFRMEITCTALLMVYKDSGSPDAGRAEVYVDGEKLLCADPKVNGWTHCNAAICFRGRQRKEYHVEVRMQAGEEGKNFTILGFGYVK